MMSQNKIDTIRAFGKNLLTPKCVSVCKYQCIHLPSLVPIRSSESLELLLL